MRSLFRCTAAILLLTSLLPCRAGELPIFDAHLHYNMEPVAHLPLDRVRALFESQGVRGILANSRPNDGTRALLEVRLPGVRVVPFLRPYRVLADVYNWFRDPATMDLLESEFPRAPYVGVGEFHLQGRDAGTEVVKGLVAFARRHGLWMLAHSDVEAIDALFALDPDARIIWAHTGFSLPARDVEAILVRHPNLYAELSYRSGLTDADGRLTQEWEQLFVRHSDRFVVGSDTWVDARWDSYGDIIGQYRRWLAQLPPEAARRIAFANAERLFGPAKQAP